MEELSIPPLRRRTRTLGAELAAHLEGLIASNALPPGRRLPPERELAAALDVSRASLRDAMHELEGKGLIERHVGRGTKVASLPDDIAAMSAGISGLGAALDDATELRTVVEPSIASLAAIRATASNIIQFEDALARSNEHLDPEESMRADIEFHLLLARAAQNPLLLTLSTMMAEWTREPRLRSHQSVAGRRASIAGHREIYEAVTARSADAAEEAMRRHLRDVHALSADAD